MAEREGFEPSVPDLPVRRFSKPLVSATHPRLRIAAARRAYSEVPLGRQGGVRFLQDKRFTGHGACCAAKLARQIGCDETAMTRDESVKGTAPDGDEVGHRVE